MAFKHGEIKMHKKIALLIKKIVDESPYSHFRCKVIPQKTGGFWKCIITFDSRADAHSAALVESLHYIGIVYGESLYIRDDGDKVLVS